MTPQLEKEILDSFRFALKNGHTPAFMKGIEQLIRNETDHFKSLAFLETYGAGMEAFSEVFDYGWNKAKGFWNKNPQYAPIGIIHMNENTSDLQVSRGQRKFIKFPNMLASIMTIIAVIEIDGRFGNWFNNNDFDETKYEQELNDIIPRYINQILAEAA